MYSTPKELHIALDQSLQHINSDSKSVIKPQEKDWLLNETQLRLIDIIIDDRKRTGYDDDQLNYDALLPIKTSRELQVLPIGGNKGVVILPSDYIHRDRIDANVIVTCGDEQEEVQTLDLYHVINIGNGGTSVPHFYPFVLTITVGFDIYSFYEVIYNYQGFNKVESKFILIKLIKEWGIDNGFDIYWEYYNDKYYPNSLIVVGIDKIVDSVDISYNGLSYYGVQHDSIVDIYNSEIEPIIKPTSLVSTEDITNMLDSEFYTTVIDKPLVTMNKHQAIIYWNDNFYVDNIVLSYIKRPRMIDSIANNMTELKNISDKIVQYTVQNIKAKISDKDYQAIINENLINN